MENMNNQSAQSGYQDVRQDFILYDSILIGEGVPSSIDGWFQTLTAFGAHDGYHGFFDQRQESQVGSAYTNMKKISGLDFPCIFTHMGMNFHYPTPVNTELFDGNRAAAKIFQEEVPLHSYCDFFLGGGDHKILTFKPQHAPFGYGITGNQVGGTGLVSYTAVLNNGVPAADNTFKFANWPMMIPATKSISIRLNLAAKARQYLTAMAAPAPIEFATGSVPSWCLIECYFRGTRDIQQLGDLRR